MPRTTWSLPLVAVLGLTLVSCFDDVKDCSTCPPVDSASIGLVLPATFDVDSVYVGLDGPPRFRLLRGRSGGFTNLSAGTHTLNSVIFRQDVSGLTVALPSTISIVLVRGESRVVVFHHDFPVVVWAPPPVSPADVRMAAASSRPPRRAG